MNPHNPPHLHRWWKSFCDILFPRRCTVCGGRLALAERHVCASCLHRMPLVPAAPVEDNPVTRAFRGLLPVERGAAMFYYHPDSAYRQILFALKYGHCPQIGYELGNMWADRLTPRHFFDGIDLLVPLPLARKRQRQRGYNQSEWIAKGIAAATGLPVRTDLVRRIVANPTQTRLHKAERYANVEGIFHADKSHSLDGKHLLLVDDVMTTGATLISCGRTLLEGTENTRISIFVLAKTMHV